MKIDVVVPWVTSNDPKWQALRQQHLPNNTKSDQGADNDEELFRDWDTLRYLLRGIHSHMPWANRIFLVTMNQRPKWLADLAKLSNGKLALIDHKDFIPKEYLPTFSSHTIELNFHRIPDLSEHFIYFNDDMLPVQDLQPAHFFDHAGLPKDQASLWRISQPNYASIYGHILLNNISLLNQHFSTQDLKSKRKIYSLRQGTRRVLASLPYLRYRNLPGFFNPHGPQPFLKSTFEKLWELEPEVLAKTCQNKFRTIHDVNQYVFRDYQLLMGSYSPDNISARVRFFKDFPGQFSALESALKNPKIKMICINDDITDDFQKSNDKMRSILDSHLPTPAPWEVT
ncbi:stealth family protein [Candidatus Saccharibacteria bacterium]|nr:stealth family protein [Candidatus Saccharibacteria bacterium]